MRFSFLSKLTLVICIFGSVHVSAQYRFRSSFYNGDHPSNKSQMMDDATPDWRGGFYTLSTVMANGTTGATLNRLNPDGSIAYTKQLEGDASISIKPNKIVTSADRFLYLCGWGEASSGYSGPMFLKLDSLGNVVWTRIYELSSFQGQFECSQVVLASDGGIVGMFNRNDYGVPPGQTSAATVLIKMNSGGTVAWSKEFRSSTINNSGVQMDVFSGEIGVTMTGNDINNGLLGFTFFAVVNNAGTVLKQTSFQTDYSSITPSTPLVNFLCSEKLANGNYLIGAVKWDGNVGSGIVIQTNNALAHLSSSEYTTASGFALEPRLIRQEASGSFAILGYCNNVIGSADGFFMRTGSVLNPITSFAYGDSRDNDFFDFGLTSDQGFFLACSNVDGMNPFFNESQVLKIDKDGSSGCSDAPFNVTSFASSFSFHSNVLAFNSLSFSATIPVVTYPVYDVTVVDHCFSLICDVQVSGAVTPVNCFGNSNGAVDLTLTNTNGSYTVAWTGPSFTSSSEDITGLVAGNYSVSITDAIGCTATASFSVTQPAQLLLSAVAASPSCTGDNDGSINLTITGGTPAYTISWTGPSSFSSSQEDINGLLAGTYNVTVNDGNTCSASGSYILVNPAPLGATFTFTQPSCNGGSNGEIVANGTGGTSPYTYVWLGGGPGTANYSNIPAGAYQVLVSDDNGCLFSTTTNLTEPSALTVIETISAPNCQLNNGSISVTAMGGVMPYTYAWSTGGTAASINGLDEGSYTLTLTDGNSCTYIETFDVDLVVDPIQICVVTVDSTSQHNVVIWDKPVMNGVSGYNIYRLVGANYTLIDFWPYDSLSQYTDSAVGINPNITSYRYRISVVDSCGNESVQSDFHETMHLTVNQGAGGVMNLIWDNYEGLSSFTYYKIGRFVNGSPNWVVIDSVTSSNTTYTDLNAVNGTTVQYNIQIVLDAPCIATRAVNHNSTRSNRTQGIIVNGVDDHTLNKLNVWPNPGVDVLRVEIPENAGVLQLEVVDMTGALVSSIPVTNASGTIALDLSALSSGVYMIRLTGSNAVYQSRWVKQQ